MTPEGSKGIKHMTSCTWNDVTKANRCHGNKTEVKCIEEGPIFPEKIQRFNG